MLNVANYTQVSLFSNIIQDSTVDTSVPFWNKFTKFHCCKIGLLPGDNVCDIPLLTQNNVECSLVWLWQYNSNEKLKMAVVWSIKLMPNFVKCTNVLVENAAK